MSERDGDRRSTPRRRRGDSRLAKFSTALLVVGIIASVLQSTVLGRISGGVTAVDVLAVAGLVLGLTTYFVVLDPPKGGGGASEDEGGGGGGSALGERPPQPPSGGLEIDWTRFEADFEAYARTHTPALPGV